MRTQSRCKPLGSGSSRRHSQSGSAVLIVVVLLGLMAAILAGNNHVLRSLKKELQDIEHRQLKHYK